MPILNSSDFTTLMMFLAGLAAIVLLVALRYAYLLRTQEQQVQEPSVLVERWLPCEECGVSTVPTALYKYNENPFHIETLCTYCALCSDVEPFVIYEEEEYLL